MALDTVGDRHVICGVNRHTDYAGYVVSRPLNDDIGWLNNTQWPCPNDPLNRLRQCQLAASLLFDAVSMKVPPAQTSITDLNHRPQSQTPSKTPYLQLRIYSLAVTDPRCPQLPTPNSQFLRLQRPAPAIKR